MLSNCLSKEINDYMASQKYDYEAILPFDYYDEYEKITYKKGNKIFVSYYNDVSECLISGTVNNEATFDIEVTSLEEFIKLLKDNEF